jgi:hypothetical protein
MPQDDNDSIAEALEQWSAETLELLKRNVEKQGLALTKDLYNSLRVEVVSQTAYELAHARFYFQIYGRFKDMKVNYFNYTGHKGFPPVAEMEKFIQKTGLENFKYIPGYKPGKVPAESMAIRRLAWGVSKGIAKRKTVAPEKWYAKTFYKRINILIDKVANIARDKAAAGVKEAFEKGQ